MKWLFVFNFVVCAPITVSYLAEGNWETAWWVCVGLWWSFVAYLGSGERRDSIDKGAARERGTEKQGLLTPCPPNERRE